MTECVVPDVLSLVVQLAEAAPALAVLFLLFSFSLAYFGDPGYSPALQPVAVKVWKVRVEGRGGISEASCF